MEEEDLANEKDITIKLEDYVEVLTTDDDRLNIIGEELSNEMGRAILNKLFDGVDSISEIATSLNASIPLVRWHIQRLLKVNLISTNHFDISEKNRKVQRYKPTKFALVIIPSSVAKSPAYLNFFKNALKKTHDKIPVLVSFIGSSILTYLVQKSLNLNQIGIQMSDPENIHHFYDAPDFLISISSGMAVALLVWILKRLKDKK